jgi:hypothetical protein
MSGTLTTLGNDKVVNFVDFDIACLKLCCFFACLIYRAVIEGQFLSMLLHCQNLGLTVSRRIICTGGASKNIHILQVVSDVFGVPVFVGSQANSASLGAAYRALHGYRCFQANKYFFFSLADMSLHRFIHLSTEMFRFIPFDQVVAAAPPFHKATEPNLDAHKIYKTMLDRYRLLEQKVVQSNSTNCQTTN